MLGPKFIAGGNFNSKTLYGAQVQQKKKGGGGRKLSKVIQEKSYSFLLTGKPTYWTNDGNKIPIH